MKQERFFNLIDESWIPVRKGAEVRLASMRECLLNASQITAIECQVSLEEAAIIRFLVSVLQRALKGPESEKELKALLQKRAFPPEKIRDYLSEWHNRFFLFHPDAPFYQVPDMPVDDEKAWTELLPYYSSGDNATLFDHTFDDSPPAITPAEAVRAILVHQSFVTGGLMRRHNVSSCKGGPVATSAVFIPLGETFFDTLLMNLIPYDYTDRGGPIWEQSPPSIKQFEGDKNKQPRTKLVPKDTTQLFTWLSRSILLIRDVDFMVRRIRYGPGVHKVENVFFQDPMCVYVKDEKKKTFMPLKFRENRSLWRDISSILDLLDHKSGHVIPPKNIQVATHLANHDERLPLKAIGQITDQKKVLAIVSETFPMKKAFFSRDKVEEIKDAVKIAEKIGRCVWKIAWHLSECLLTILKETRPQNKEINKFAGNIPLESLYWSNLESSFFTFLLLLGDDSERAWSYWRNALKTAVHSAWSITKQTLGTRARNIACIERQERALWRKCLKILNET